MADTVCPHCGAPFAPEDTECKYCGEALLREEPCQPVYQQPVYRPPVYQQPPLYPNPMVYDGIDPSWPIKSKVVAGILALFLGGLGIHKFYLGKAGSGIVYLLFCWTFIPAFIGFIEGIVYLCSSDHNFSVKYRVRLQ